MAKANFEVDFIDMPEEQEELFSDNDQADQDKHRRAGIAHKLAVILMLHRRGKNGRSGEEATGEEAEAPVKVVKLRKGALDGITN